MAPSLPALDDLTRSAPAATVLRSSKEAPPHVVIVPVPGQGHLTPAISIARYLAASGISVTLALAARAHCLLYGAASSPNGCDHMQTPNLRVEVIPDGTTSPGKAKTGDSKERFSLADMKAIFINMHKNLPDLLRRLMDQPNPPCCLLHDPILAWCSDVALKFGLPRIAIWTCSVSFLSIGIHLPELLARGYLPAPDQESLGRAIDFIPGLSSFCIADLPPVFLSEEGLRGPHLEFLKSSFDVAKSAERVLVNTTYELESDVVDHLRKEGIARAEPVGPLFLTENVKESSTMSTAMHKPVSLKQEDNHCLSWLEKQAEGSVMYVSFGSVSYIDDHVYEEMAYGLEASGVPFLWVIRPDAYGAAGRASAEELLPEGFTERTEGRGLVISWAPQLSVLGHPAVGAFLTHCGWNSVLESVCKGVPMLGFPQLVDEWVNQKLIVREWKVGLALPVSQPLAIAADKQAAADEEANLASPCTVHRSHVQASVIAIVNGDEGATARRNARAWRDVIARQVASGASTTGFDQLVHDLVSGSFACKKIEPRASRDLEAF